MREHEAKLKAIVSSAKPHLPPDEVQNLDAAALRLGLAEGSFTCMKELREHIDQQVAEALKWDNAGTGLGLRDLITHLELRRLVDKLPFDHAIRLLEGIHDSLHTRAPFPFVVPPFSAANRWSVAVNFVSDRLLVAPQRPLGSRTDPRIVSVAKGILALRQHGYVVGIKNGKASITPKELFRIANHLETSLSSLGGGPVIAALFEMLDRTYVEEQDRYHIVQTVSTVPYAPPRKLVPYGYLLSLALKHLGSAPTHQNMEDWREAFENLVNIASSLADALDIRTFSALEVMWVNLSNVFAHIQRAALFDSTHAFDQGRRTDLADCLRHLFDWVSPEAKFGRGWTMPEMLEAVACMVNASGKTRGAVEVTPHDLTGSSERPTMNIEQAHAILDDLSQDSRSINPYFHFPWDRPKDTFYKRPLVKHNGRYIICDMSWRTPSFFWAVERHVENAPSINNTGRQIGDALERYTHKLLRQRGVETIGGRYHVGDIQGDCDVVVETTDAIILIEIKKKALTVDARGGDSVSLIADIARSAFSAQTQAAKAEYLLYRDGQLELSHQRTRRTLHRNGREIERISLTLSDYGFLQDRTMLANLLNLLPGRGLKAKQTRRQREVDEMVAAGHKLLEWEEKLRGLRQHDAPPFFFCWFLSLGQLQVILDNTSDAETFWSELKRVRHMTMGTRNFYYEYKVARDMNTEAAVLAEGVPSKDTVAVP